MRRIAFAALLFAPLLARAQGAPVATPAPSATAAPAESDDIKHDQGTVRTVDAQRGLVICDLPDGPVTYDISAAQLIDAEGKAAGVAANGLKTGDKVRITYVVNNGAKASEVRILK